MIYLSEVNDVISAARACEFWASTDYGVRGVDLRACAAVLRQPSTIAAEDAREAIQRLKGEADVLVDLLRESLNVIDAIDGDDTPECESLMDLTNRIKYAIRGAVIREMTARGIE